MNHQIDSSLSNSLCYLQIFYHTPLERLDEEERADVEDVKAVTEGMIQSSIWMGGIWEENAGCFPIDSKNQ
jgi:hypothetical protein